MQDIELVLGVSHKHLSDDNHTNVSVPTGSTHCPADHVQREHSNFVRCYSVL